MNDGNTRNRILQLAGRPWLVFLFVSCLTGIEPLPQDALADDEDTQARITAACVLNFCKFVQWPDKNGDRIVLGVIGDQQDAEAFALIDGKTVGEATMEVITIADPAQLDGCQLVFVPARHKDQVPTLVAAVGESPVLTISNSKDFARNGGMIGLATVRGKTRFDINSREAKASGLVMSSQLLKMARSVLDGN